MLEGPELLLVLGLVFGGVNLLRVYKNGGKQTKRATVVLLVIAGIRLGGKFARDERTSQLLYMLSRGVDGLHDAGFVCFLDWGTLLGQVRRDAASNIVPKQLAHTRWWLAVSGWRDHVR
jgi:hypothetical protein